MNNRILRYSFPITVFLIVVGSHLVGAGELNPPAGPVAPTMKTLAEIEPRIAINATNTPGDADSLFKIIQRGSYYLTGNVTAVPGKHGIEIAASGVTVNLNGFELLGIGSFTGIIVSMSGQSNIAVVNGSIRSWGDGVDLLTSQPSKLRLSDLRVSGNGGMGLRAFKSCTISGCTVSSNSGHGIYADSSCTITGCTSTENGGVGITTVSDGTISDCTASSNSAGGISAGDRALVLRCTADSNANFSIGIVGGLRTEIDQCHACENLGGGIVLGSGRIAHCIVSNNAGGDGIRVADRCIVVDNICDNSLPSAGAALHATGSNNSVEYNFLTGYARGIDIDAAGNIVSNNTVKGNMDNYDIAAGNQLKILLCQLPEAIDWPALVTMPGILTAVSGQPGITINSDDVTIDLSGHALVGVGGSGAGISCANRNNITIRNGTVRGWAAAGINLNAGGPPGSGALIESVHAFSNFGIGIQTQNSAVLRFCTANDNNGGGINALSSAVIESCTAYLNTGAGIVAQTASVIRSCTSYQNSSSGFFGGSGCTISDCVSRDNGLNGILVSSGSKVSECLVADNNDDGIEVSSTCDVRNNHCYNNGHELSIGSGIYATNGRNHIEGNVITGCVKGLHLETGDGNIVSGNFVYSNDFNYMIPSGIGNQIHLLLSQIPETIDWPATVTLAGDLTGMNGQNGLTINADGVTVDLGGHGLIGVAGSLAGIRVPAAHKNLTIKNGRVANWGAAGISAANADSSRFTDLLASSNGSGGILAGEGCTLQGITSSNNAGDGITISTGCVIEHVVALANSANGISSSGASTIRSCTTRNSGASGINCGAGSVIESCSSNANAADGIVVNNDSVIRGNVCDSNGLDPGDGAGIHITGSDNRIEGNNCTDTDRGIDVDGSGNIIIRNTCSGNTTNWDIAANNKCLVILGVNAGAILGDSGGASPGSTDPNANFTY